MNIYDILSRCLAKSHARRISEFSANELIEVIFFLSFKAVKRLTSDIFEVI